MSLRHIMLGMLREPNSGYDLKKGFDRSLRNFWRAELSQIYPLLQKMDDKGLLTSKEDPSSVGPTRRVYTRTTKGRKELMSWLSGGPTVGTERIGYLGQVYFLSELKDDDNAVEFMQRLRDYMDNWLETLRAVEKTWEANDPRYPDDLPDEEFYAQLTLQMGLTKVRANREWCDQSIRRIRSRQSHRHRHDHARNS